LSVFKKLVTKARVRQAARGLASDPSAGNYVALAREYVVAGQTDEVLRICTEGLDIHPNNVELQRLAERARQLQVEERTRALLAEAQTSPRPAVLRELCEMLLESGRLSKADEVARRWFDRTRDGEAVYYCARVALARFLTDRRQRDGLSAYRMAIDAQAAMKNDPRPLFVQEEIAARAGAYQEARRALARLLELMPGDPSLEARFRHVLHRCEQSKELERGLADVERTGRFAGDEPDKGKPNAHVAVRPMLQEISANTDVRAAVYLRGGTALVQGPRGATADRTARAVRELVQETCTVTQRLRLGQPFEVRLEGDFGALLLAPAAQGASAVWCVGAVKHHHEQLLKDLSGMAGFSGGGA